MNNKSFSISEAFKFGWRGTINNFGVFLLITFVRLFVAGIVFFAITKLFYAQSMTFSCSMIDGMRSCMARSGIGLLTQEYGMLGMLPLTALLAFIDSFFSLGLIKLALAVYEGRHASLQEFKRIPLRMLINNVVLTFIYLLGVQLGSLALIIPGLLIALTFAFSFFYLVDSNCDAITAMRASYQFSWPALLTIFGFFALVFFVNFLGALLFGIGLLFTQPITLLAEAYAYRMLLVANGAQ